MSLPDPVVLQGLLDAEIARRARIKRCEGDFLEFFRTYFPQRTDDITPAFHRELAEMATNDQYVDPVTGEKVWWNSRGKKKKGMVLAAPRGHAKTTILTFALSMWWLAYRKKRFIILVNNAASGAIENCLDIRDELETNELFKADFGDLKGQDLGYKWTQGDFVAVHRNRSGKVVWTTRICAKSPGAKVRGIKHNGKRPDALLVDDLENDESVENPEQIEKVHNWLNKAAIPALDPRHGMFVMIGTIMHFDAVLARLLDPVKYSEIYVQKTYKAYWNDGKKRVYLWPERFTPDDLEMTRKRLGSLAFNCEYLNEPVDPDTRRFRPEWVCWYRKGDLKHKNNSWYFRRGEEWVRLKLFQAVDPAVREKEQNDYFSHMTIGVTEESDILKRAIVIFPPYRDRIDFPAQVQTIIRQYNTFPMTKTVGIEAVAYQAALKQEILRQEFIPIREIEHNAGKKDKMARITSMSVLFENGQIYLRAADEDEAGELEELENPSVRVHHLFRTLYDNLMRYPRISHDDDLDTLEMAIGLANRTRVNFHQEAQEDKPYDGPFDQHAHPDTGLGVPGLSDQDHWLQTTQGAFPGFSWGQ